MRAAVALIIMVATVLHLAAGCCRHASHFDGGARCCGGTFASEAAAACCMDHDHDHGHDRKPEPASPGGDAHGSSGMGGVIAGQAAIHDCGGCRCAAKIENDRGDDVPLSARVFLTSAESEALVRTQAARGPCEARDPPVPSALRPPLCERLVV